MKGLQSRRVVQKRMLILGTLLVGAALLFIINNSTIIVHADTEQNYVYESVEVMHNDSVWSIAKRYCPNDMEIKEYMNIIEEINGINSDYIVEGNYLLIPVYE